MHSNSRGRDILCFLWARNQLKIETSITRRSLYDQKLSIVLVNDLCFHLRAGLLGHLLTVADLVVVDHLVAILDADAELILPAAVHLPINRSKREVIVALTIHSAGPFQRRLRSGDHHELVIGALEVKACRAELEFCIEVCVRLAVLLASRTHWIIYRLSA